MDNVSARALLLCSKDPLGQCGKVILAGYVDDLRVYAHESDHLPQHAYQPPAPPLTGAGGAVAVAVARVA